MTNCSLLENRRALSDILRHRYNTRQDGERGRCEEYFHDNVSFPRITRSFSIKALPEQTI
jgi:hypothetical protein